MKEEREMLSLFPLFLLILTLEKYVGGQSGRLVLLSAMLINKGQLCSKELPPVVSQLFYFLCSPLCLSGLQPSPPLPPLPGSLGLRALSLSPPPHFPPNPTLFVAEFKVLNTIKL